MRLLSALRLAGAAFFVSLSFLAIAQSQETRGSARGVLERDFAQYLAWFEGRFDNDRQVFFEPDIGVPESDRHERIHSIFRPVALPAFGDHVFYVEQYLDADPARVYRQRLYVMSIDESRNAIRLAIHIPKNPDAIRGAYLNPDLLAQLTPADMTTYPGCDVFWRRQETMFVGGMAHDACRITSTRSGRTLIVSDDLILSADGISIHDRAVDEQGAYVYGNRAGVPHQLRRARPFECWTAVLRGAVHGDSGQGAEPNDWNFRRGLWLHDQGGTADIVTDENPSRRFTVKLRRVEWPYGTNRPSLTLYVHEQGNPRALSYTWGEYDAERLGLNLRWLQVSCTHAPQRPWG
ncbi:MAG: chromophore lyase CpcT/CpeT [Caulobacterales bacterium]|jgi:hypothetical protein